MKKFITFLFLYLFLFESNTFAALNLDRTRVIYNAEDNGVGIAIENSDKTDPFLAQTWIEDANGVKIKGPLVALPLLQRLDPGQKKQIKISILGNENLLPQDRESIFYFNVLGVPPKTKLENAVEIVIQSKLKLFYRPKGLKKYIDNNWPTYMTVERKGSELVLNNPTPYNIIIININNTIQKVKDFQPIILPPYSTYNYKLNNQNQASPEIVIIYVDDYGAAKELYYTCKSTTCSLQDKKTE